MPKGIVNELTRKVIFVLVATFIASWKVSAVAPTDSTAAVSLLKSALQQQDAATSLHTLEIQQKATIQIQFEKYKKRAPDGFIFERDEIMQIGTNRPAGKFLKRILITNREGYWSIKASKAILLKYVADRQKISMKIDPDYYKPPIDSSNQFKLEDTSYDKKPCIKVTMMLSDNIYQDRLIEWLKIMNERTVKDGGSLEKFAASMGSKEKFSTPQAGDVVPYVWEFIIDKNTKVVWSKKNYSKAGNLIFEENYTQIDVGLPLADDIFEIPKNLQVINAETAADHLRLEMMNN